MCWERIKRGFLRGLDPESLAERLGSTVNHAVRILFVLGGLHLTVFMVDRLVPHTEEWAWFHDYLHKADKVFAFCSILGILFWGAYEIIFAHKDDDDPPSSPPNPPSGRYLYVTEKKTGKRYKIPLIQAMASIAAGIVEVQFGSQPWLTYGTFFTITAVAAGYFHFTKWHWFEPQTLEQQVGGVVGVKLAESGDVAPA